ncbi:MAG: NAD(P)H-dependent flavin oxidoreductase [Pseudomonadota bacterium]
MTAARFLSLTGAAVPIVQAPMAGAGGVPLAAAAMRGGALGSLPCGMLTPAQVAEQASALRDATDASFNLNFFCHPLPSPPDETQWRALLEPLYDEEGVSAAAPPPLRRPFDDALCAAVETVRPAVVSFHFGLPAPELVARVRATGARIFGNATSVPEARWLAAQGCDAIIAQGAEAGGHAGWFLDRHVPAPLARLLPAIVDAVDVPVIAAGGIVDERDLCAALAAGAAAVQIGTAYLAAPESSIAAPHRALIGTAESADTAFTNLFSGRAARGIRNRLMRRLGDWHPAAPPFPYASAALAPLRAHAEADGRGDYSPLWAGAGAPRARPDRAEDYTRRMAEAARHWIATQQRNSQ